jgi:hypothetical protein
LRKNLKSDLKSDYFPLSADVRIQQNAMKKLDEPWFLGKTIDLYNKKRTKDYIETVRASYDILDELLSMIAVRGLLKLSQRPYIH